MFPYDAITVAGSVSISTGTSPQVILDISSLGLNEYTILSAYYYSDLRNSNVDIYFQCGSTRLMRQTSQGSSSSMPIEKSSQIIGNIICDDDYQLVTSNATSSVTMLYNVTYVPYNINTSTTSPTYIDSTQNIVFLLLVAFVLLWIFIISVVYNKIFKQLS